MQADSAAALKYKSSLDGLLTILREEGVEGLYEGIGSKLIQSVLTAAILFAGQRRIYEIAKKVHKSLVEAFCCPDHIYRLSTRALVGSSVQVNSRNSENLDKIIRLCIQSSCHLHGCTIYILFNGMSIK
jgi:hypothetical protein